MLIKFKILPSYQRTSPTSDQQTNAKAGREFKEVALESEPAQVYLLQIRKIPFESQR